MTKIINKMPAKILVWSVFILSIRFVFTISYASQKGLEATVANTETAEANEMPSWQVESSGKS